MQSLLDLKDQIVERLLEVWHRINENDRFIELKDRYQSLPQHYQSLIKTLGFLLLVWFLYKIPASYMSSSIDKEQAFEANRNLTRDVIHAGKLEQTIVAPTPGPKGSSLENQVQSILRGERILPEQIKPMAAQEKVASGKIITQKIDQTGLKVRLKDLNLEQMVKVGEKVDRIPGVRLINWVAQANSKDEHLFAVDFELASFSATLETGPIEKPSTKKKKKRKKKKGKK